MRLSIMQLPPLSGWRVDPDGAGGTSLCSLALASLRVSGPACCEWSGSAMRWGSSEGQAWGGGPKKKAVCECV